MYAKQNRCCQRTHATYCCCSVARVCVICAYFVACGRASAYTRTVKTPSGNVLPHALTHTVGAHCAFAGDCAHYVLPGQAGWLECGLTNMGGIWMGMCSCYRLRINAFNRMFEHVYLHSTLSVIWTCMYTFSVALGVCLTTTRVWVFNNMLLEMKFKRVVVWMCWMREGDFHSADRWEM